MGTYLVHFETQSGNCDAPPDSLVNIAAAGMMAMQDCTVNAAETSSNGCRVDIDETCMEPGRSTVRLTEIIEANNNESTELHGTASVTVIGSCSGTFKMRWTKQ
jgi:hypothetical protein